MIGHITFVSKHDLCYVQADDDLYGDLPDLNLEPEQDAVSMDVDAADVHPPDASVEEARPDEAIAAIQDAGAVKVEEQPPEDISVESAFAQIAEALGLKDAAPREVLTGFSQIAAQAHQQPVKTLQERTNSIVDQVQVCSLSWPFDHRAAVSKTARPPACPSLALHATPVRRSPTSQPRS